MAASVLAATAGGCGTSEAERQAERRRAAEQELLRKKAAGLEEEIAALKAQQPQGTATAGEKQTAGRPPASSRPCGAGVAAGAKTSCAFALNTAREWVDTSGGTQIQVYSPAKRRNYTMKCSIGLPLTTCRGGKGAVVYIP